MARASRDAIFFKYMKAIKKSVVMELVRVLLL